MGVSTHVLDTMHGCPAAGMGVALYTTHGGQASLVKRLVLNADGRNPDGPLYDNHSLKPATLNTVTAAIACGGDVHVLVAGKDAGAVATAAAQITGVSKVWHAEAAVFAHGLDEHMADQVLALASG